MNFAPTTATTTNSAAMPFAAQVQAAASQAAAAQKIPAQASAAQSPSTQTAAQAAAAQAAPDPHEVQVRAKIKDSAKAFEASFLSMMYQNIFQDIDLGGGQGGDAFKSFLMDAVGKQMTKAGGVGLTPIVQREMLKLQGLQ
jgi:flagellar protein FlgJ